MSTPKFGGRIAIAAILASTVGLGAVQSAFAAMAYNYPGPPSSPIPGPGIATPTQVVGKEYSHDSDLDLTGAIDPAQVLAWDGVGGTADGLDYSLPAPPFSTSGIFEADALANAHDALFRSLLIEEGGQLGPPQVMFPDVAHLVFSIDDLAHTGLGLGLMPTSVQAGGPVITNGGAMIGGAGEISFEKAGAFHPPSTQGIWATQAQINMMPPRDVDGLELWGAEPVTASATGNVAPFGDADKYSVDVDISTGTVGGPPPYSVWDYDSAGGSIGYVTHAQVVGLVRQLLGEPNLSDEAINLDALMVLDDIGPDNQFDAGDKILFSIRQVVHTAALDGTGFQATGSEIFWMDGSSTPAVPVGGFLFHGGHLWNKAYALGNLQTAVVINDVTTFAQLDINALEAVGVPEPASAVLLMFGAFWLAISRGTTVRRQGSP